MLGGPVESVVSREERFQRRSRWRNTRERIASDGPLKRVTFGHNKTTVCRLAFAQATFHASDHPESPRQTGPYYFELRLACAERRQAAARVGAA